MYCAGLLFNLVSHASKPMQWSLSFQVGLTKVTTLGFEIGGAEHNEWYPQGLQRETVAQLKFIT